MSTNARLAAERIDDLLIRSYIVFSERCKLQKVTATSLDVWVLKRGELKSQLSRDLRNSMCAISPATANMAYELLNRYTRADEAVKYAYVAAIKRKKGTGVLRKGYQESRGASGSCPSCDGELKLYQGRRAEHWGCVTCSYWKKHC